MIYRIFLTLILWVVLTSKGISQDLSDSVTCLPNRQLRQAIKELETCNIIKQQYDLCEQNNDLLLSRIEGKDSIISNYKQKEILQNQKVENFEKLIANLNAQSENNSKIFDLKLKVHKRRKWYFAGGGVFVGAILGALIAK